MTDIKDYVDNMYKGTTSNYGVNSQTLVIVMWMYIICKVLIALFYNTNSRYITNIPIEDK